MNLSVNKTRRSASQLSKRHHGARNRCKLPNRRRTSGTTQHASRSCIARWKTPPLENGSAKDRCSWSVYCPSHHTHTARTYKHYQQHTNTSPARVAHTLLHAKSGRVPTEAGNTHTRRHPPHTDTPCPASYRSPASHRCHGLQRAACLTEPRTAAHGIRCPPSPPRRRGRSAGLCLTYAATPSSPDTRRWRRPRPTAYAGRLPTVTTHACARTAGTRLARNGISGPPQTLPSVPGTRA